MHSVTMPALSPAHTAWLQLSAYMRAQSQDASEGELKKIKS
jgi:hypothetical protein